MRYGKYNNSGAKPERPTRKRLCILGALSTALHFDDTKNLLSVLHTLADRGNTVVVIEHHLDVHPAVVRVGGETRAAIPPFEAAGVGWRLCLALDCAGAVLPLLAHILGIPTARAGLGSDSAIA